MAIKIKVHEAVASVPHTPLYIVSYASNPNSLTSSRLTAVESLEGLLSIDSDAIWFSRFKWKLSNRKESKSVLAAAKELGLAPMDYAYWSDPEKLWSEQGVYWTAPMLKVWPISKPGTSSDQGYTLVKIGNEMLTVAEANAFIKKWCEARGLSKAP